MAENLIISDGNKADKYAVLYRQIESIANGEEDTIAKISTYGIIGDKYIKLEIGNDKELLKPNGK